MGVRCPFAPTPQADDSSSDRGPVVGPGAGLVWVTAKNTASRYTAPMSDAHWQTTDLAGVPADRFEPPGGAAGTLLFLPDFDGWTPRRSPAWTDALARRRLRVLAPTPGPVWWLDRDDPAMNGENPVVFLTERVLPTLTDGHNLPVLAGVGVGGQAALKLGFGPGRCPAVLAVAPAVDLHTVHGRGSTLDALFDSPEAARQHSVLLDVNGLTRPRRLSIRCDPSDPWFDGAERLVMKLRSGGVPVEAEFVTTAADRVAFLEHVADSSVNFLADAAVLVV